MVNKFNVGDQVAYCRNMVLKGFEESITLGGIIKTVIIDADKIQYKIDDELYNEDHLMTKDELIEKIRKEYLA